MRCLFCKRDMTTATSCIVHPFPDGSLPQPFDGDTCHDCRVRRGGFHHPGCDAERCPHGQQAISCDECEVTP